MAAFAQLRPAGHWRVKRWRVPQPEPQYGAAGSPRRARRWAARVRSIGDGLPTTCGTTFRTQRPMTYASGGDKNILRRISSVSTSGPVWIPSCGRFPDDVSQRERRGGGEDRPVLPAHDPDPGAARGRLPAGGGSGWESASGFDPGTSVPNPDFDPARPVSEQNLQFRRSPFPNAIIPPRGRIRWRGVPSRCILARTPTLARFSATTTFVFSPGEHGRRDDYETRSYVSWRSTGSRSTTPSQTGFHSRRGFLIHGESRAPG